MAHRVVNALSPKLLLYITSSLFHDRKLLLLFFLNLLIHVCIHCLGHFSSVSFLKISNFALSQVSLGKINTRTTKVQKPLPLFFGQASMFGCGLQWLQTLCEILPCGGQGLVLKSSVIVLEPSTQMLSEQWWSWTNCQSASAHKSVLVDWRALYSRTWCWGWLKWQSARQQGRGPGFNGSTKQKRVYECRRWQSDKAQRTNVKFPHAIFASNPTAKGMCAHTGSNSWPLVTQIASAECRVLFTFSGVQWWFSEHRHTRHCFRCLGSISGWILIAGNKVIEMTLSTEKVKGCGKGQQLRSCGPSSAQR
jgi:hypothetical protein